ncbi:MAG: type II toxin-antitoxin system RelE/ParE family toxin [Erysipelotrichaceae bacterium]|nr:type II toxin-antitoxin system RelE/ParE family toxin [Erysipelotrichaceae bacterium]
MIRTFKDKEIQKVYHQVFSRKLPPSIQRAALRKMMIMDHVENLSQLNNPPGNHLEALHGDREGSWSIRINDQFRICFRYEEQDFYDVEITDYH